jgi:hypothetical protein
MSIRPGNVGSIEIDTGVGAVKSETYNPQTKAEYGRGGTAGLAYGGTYVAATTQSAPELLPLQ